MILLVAVLLGAIAGLARAWWGRRRFDARPVNQVWLIAVAALLQGLAFYFPPTRSRIPDQLAAFLLVSSQACLLAFVCCNRAERGLWILGAGLALNLLVIAANGGLMPLSPQLAAQLAPADALRDWESATRFGWSKDILLERAETHLWWLSDCFLSPTWFPWRYAFSLGDVLIAIGAFWTLWARGGPQRIHSLEMMNLKDEPAT